MDVRPGLLKGRSAHGLPVTLAGAPEPPDLIGTRVRVELESATAYGLAGRPTSGSETAASSPIA